MALLTMDQRGDGPELMWLHGFTQTRATAEPFLSILAGNHRILTPDLPGHGASVNVRGSLTETAALVQHLRPQSPSTLGGYSFGGRVALHLALAYPESVSRLILLSTSMGIANDDGRTQRRRADEELAQRIRDDGVASFHRYWRSLPLFSSVSDDAWGSRSSDGAGLASSLEEAGVGTQEYLAERLPTLTMPTLLLYGSLDDRYAEAAHAMAALLPRASVVAIEGAGHAAHLEQPDVVAEAIEVFLANA